MENLKYTELLVENKNIKVDETFIELNVGILSNVIVNSCKEVLELKCKRNGINAKIEFGNYDNIVQDSISFQNKNLVIIFNEILNIVDSIEDYFEDISTEKYNQIRDKIINEYYILFNNLKKCDSVILNNFSHYHFNSHYSNKSLIKSLVNEVNDFIDKNSPMNFNIIDLNKIFTKIGLSNSIDKRLYFSSKAPYTFNFFKSYVSEIEPIISKNCGKFKKALIFDCDNTLWNGIIGEDGIDGIDLSPNSKKGYPFFKVQQLAIALSKKGVILGLCSKNNESDVLDCLKNNSLMLIKEENIIISKINWEDKATNLQNIAKELNIGLDSIVFVDDSKFEINLINEKLPEIFTYLVPTNLDNYFYELEALSYKLFNFSVTTDDLRKTTIYKQQIERNKSKEEHNNIDDYLSSLNIEISVNLNDIDSLARIAQLTQKTNQFNLTTRRYSETNISEFINDPNTFVFSMSVKDKYGDNGLTGVAICKSNPYKSKSIIFDTFLMSCRIIGRNIEFEFFHLITTYLNSIGYFNFHGEFILTKKNSQVESFYSLVGMKEINNNQIGKTFEMDFYSEKSKKINYIKSKLILD